MTRIAVHRLVLPALLGVATLTAGCMPDGLLIRLVSGDQGLREKVIKREGAFVADKIVVIDVAGVLLNMPEPKLLREGEHPVSLLLEQLDKARRDRNVKAVVLRINSPGGSVTASELMHEEISRFRSETGKPVVACLQDVAASGGYYVACACDEIMAQRSSVTGSIGVLVQLFEFTGTMAKLGITGTAITSGPNKVAGSPFDRLSDEQRALFQQMVDHFHDQFVAVVAAGRPDLDEPQVRELADGRVYTAGQALELGLIDRIGTMPEAIASAKERAGVEKMCLVRYHRPIGYAANYHAAAPAPGGEVNLIRVDLPSLWSLTAPKFMYLWAPGAG